MYLKSVLRLNYTSESLGVFGFEITDQWLSNWGQGHNSIGRSSFWPLSEIHSGSFKKPYGFGIWLLYIWKDIRKGHCLKRKKHFFFTNIMKKNPEIFYLLNQFEVTNDMNNKEWNLKQNLSHLLTNFVFLFILYYRIWNGKDQLFCISFPVKLWRS